jgi:hypothetical protein
MNDVDRRIKALLGESIDAELGDRLRAPKYDAVALAARAARSRRVAVWVLPLAAAAAVAAIVSGTVAVVDAASGGQGGVQPGTVGSAVAPPSAATTPSAAAAASQARAQRLAQQLARQRAQAAQARLEAAQAAAAQALQAQIDALVRGPWHGHDRTLTVAESGVATEMVTSGCCGPQLHVTLTLSNPTGTGSTGTDLSVTATGRVTSVHLDPGFAYAPGASRPTVGETGTVRVEGGVLTEPFTGTTYCGRGVNRCGA